MDVAPKPALADSTNALPPPAAKTPPRPAADEPPVVARFVGTNDLPAGAGRAAALAALLQPAPLRPAPPAAPPKESSSAFVFFGRATRDDIKAAHPDWSLGDVGRELSKRWQALDDAAKKTFHDLAAADKERYESEKAAYEAYEAANQPAPPVVAESAPPAPPPRKKKKKKKKRKAPVLVAQPLPETKDWEPDNDGVEYVDALTGLPPPPKKKKQKKKKAKVADSEDKLVAKTKKKKTAPKKKTVKKITEAPRFEDNPRVRFGLTTADHKSDSDKAAQSALNKAAKAAAITAEATIWGLGEDRLGSRMDRAVKLLARVADPKDPYRTGDARFYIKREK